MICLLNCCHGSPSMYTQTHLSKQTKAVSEKEWWPHKGPPWSGALCNFKVTCVIMVVHQLFNKLKKQMKAVSEKEKWWPHKGPLWRALLCQVTISSQKTVRWSSFLKLRWSSDKGSVFLIRATIDGNPRSAMSFAPKTAAICATL